MRIVFFQNCISPHQMPYIEALSCMDSVERVTVVAPCATLEERSALGWTASETDETDRLKILVDPHLSEVRAVLSQADVALFSGINAFPALLPWLKLSLDFPLRRGCITEAPLTYSVDGGMRRPLWLHRIKFLLKDYRYAKHFDRIFAIGPEAVAYYRSWHLPWKVVPFLYCPKSPIDEDVEEVCGPVRLLYVGALTLRKDVGTLLRALVNAPFEYTLTIIGDGSERAVLENYAIENSLQVEFRGSLPMVECQRSMKAHDVLILPSLHDGWGAVVNEAMSVGTYVICSDHCGARQLLIESETGMIFPSGEASQLRECLSAVAHDLAEVRSRRVCRKQWAQSHISPQAVAQRMIENL